MPPLPILTADQLIKILERHGFERKRQDGSHIRMKHPDGRATTVPKHGKRDIRKGLLKSIMRDAGLDVEDLTK